MTNGKGAIIFTVILALAASILFELPQALAQLAPPSDNQSKGTNNTANNTTVTNATVSNTTIDQAFNSLRDTFGSIFKK